MTDAIQVFTTVNSRDAAETIARGLVEAHLAACTQIVGPIQSTYWWQGEVVRDEEYLILIKTRHDLYGQVEEWIKAHHPYTVPEILAVPVTAGNPDYLRWLDASVQRPTAQA